jgi:PAS domain S-box-containing protein
MRLLKFKELINIDILCDMAENLYAASGIPIGIIDVDGTIHVKTGWQDICTKYHRIHPSTCSRCITSDNYINEHLKDGGYIAYRCLNHMWDIAMPIIVAGEHMATIFLGQFFYDDEVIDIEYFRAQARLFGFDEKNYLDALKKVPVFSKKKVEHIMKYYSSLVVTLAESSLSRLEYEDSQGKLRKSKEYMNKIFNSVNDAIVIHDANGNMIDVNDSATAMTGYSFKELINMNIKTIISENSPINPVELMELMNKAMSSSPLMIELIAKNKNNEDFWVEVNIHFTNICGIDRVVATVRNISERKKTEIALKNQATELEKLRTEFFANISHELRTPLNIILGTMQLNRMITEDKDTPINRDKLKNNINIGKQNCFRLLRLINNLIDSTKLGSCDFKLNMINCDIVNVVEEITLSVAEYINSNNLTLIFDTDIEEKIVACDADKIERIMLNLLSNSVKFTGDGGSIFVNILDGEEYITISIEDTGVGIPEDKLNIIFDRFRQVDNSFTRNHEGSGIGLSLVKSLVEMHGGTISVSSKYGIGTKFLIKLPVNLLELHDQDEETKLVNSNMETNVERIKIEFSDLYR